MGTDITGWVEIEKNVRWFGIVRIQVLMGRNYRMFNFLFGGRSENFDEAVAGNRGVPNPASREVQDHWGGLPGYASSWITWKELEQINWSIHQDILSDDWRRLFEIMRILSEDAEVSEVRLVVDFF